MNNPVLNWIYAVYVHTQWALVLTQFKTELTARFGFDGTMETVYGEADTCAEFYSTYLIYLEKLVSFDLLIFCIIQVHLLPLAVYQKVRFVNYSVVIDTVVTVFNLV